MTHDRDLLALVAWDGSNGAHRALAWAADHAKRTGCRLAVVHVVPPATLAPPPRGLPPDLVEDQRAAIERALRDTARDAALRHEIEPHIDIAVSNSPAEALLAAIERHRASLVVMGTRGRGKVAELVLGSVAHQVARSSPVPVVLVPDAPQDTRG